VDLIYEYYAMGLAGMNRYGFKVLTSPSSMNESVCNSTMKEKEEKEK